MTRRFNPWTVVLHWSHALPYLTAVGTAAASLFGHVRTTLAVHSWAGLAVVVLPVLVVLAGDRRGIRQDMAAALGGFGRRRPAAAAAYNAGQRFNTSVAVVNWLLLGATGLFLWRWPGALGVRLIHAILGGLGTVLVAGHVTMALLHPRTLRDITAVRALASPEATAES